MNTVERVRQECKKKEISISRLEKECGFSNGYIRNLREGKIPADRLKKISAFLDVPYLLLLDGTIEGSYITNEERELLAAFRNAPESTKDIIRKILDIKKDASGSLTEAG